MNAPRKRPEELRSHQWYGTDGLRSFSHRARTRQLGYLPEEHLGKPVVAILNTWSDINPCHVHLRDRAQAVKRGCGRRAASRWSSRSPPSARPSRSRPPMLYRNLLAMETEELLRSYPVDGAVLMGGCDKSTPALLMGAASVDLPTVFVPAGPMLPGHWRGEVLGPGTYSRKYWDDKRAGLIGDCEMAELESGPGPLARALHDHGHGLHAHRGGRGARGDRAGRVQHPGRGLRARSDGRAIRHEDR